MLGKGELRGRGSKHCNARLSVSSLHHEMYVAFVQMFSEEKDEAQTLENGRKKDLVFTLQMSILAPHLSGIHKARNQNESWIHFLQKLCLRMLT